MLRGTRNICFLSSRLSRPKIPRSPHHLPLLVVFFFTIATTTTIHLLHITCSLVRFFPEQTVQATQYHQLLVILSATDLTHSKCIPLDLFYPSRLGLAIGCFVVGLLEWWGVEILRFDLGSERVIEQTGSRLTGYACSQGSAHLGRQQRRTHERIKQLSFLPNLAARRTQPTFARS